MANKTALKEMVRDILKDELYSLLEDVRYRLTLLDSTENGRLLIGSQTHEVLTHSHVPVLVVR